MTTAAEISTLERLDKLESRIQIDDLLSGYAFGCDQHDAERWLSVFSDDADWLIGGELGNPIGRAAISAAFSEVWKGSPETHHWITDRVVEFEGPDAAVGEAHVVCHMRSAEDKDYLVAAHYDNEYVRRDGDWKMSKVHIEIYWQKEVQLIEP